MPRCLCLINKGTECTRDASTKKGDDTRFCWQHQKCKKITQSKQVVYSKTKTGKPLYKGKISPPKITKKSQYLLENFPLEITDLSDNKNLPYDQFISKILRIVNEIHEDEERIKPEKMNIIEYPESSININIPIDTGEDYGEKTYTLTHQGGFTQGQLLYQLAQIIPDQEWGSHRYFEGLSLKEDGTYDLSLGS